MIKRVWKWYIAYLLQFLDTDKYLNGDDEDKSWIRIKLGIFQLVTMILFGFLNILIFYYWLGSPSMLYAFGVGFGWGRLFSDWELRRYDKNYPYEQKYNKPFLQIISTLTIAVVVIGATINLIKETYNNNTYQSSYEMSVPSHCPKTE